MAFRMSGPTQQAPFRYRGNRMRPKPAPEPYVAPAPVAPGPGTGGLDTSTMGRGRLGGGGNNSDLDGNYDAMMARIKAGQSGAGFYHGQPITGPTPDAPGAVAGYNGQPQGNRQPYPVPGPNDNLGLNGHANGTYGGYAEGGAVEEDGGDDLSAALAVVKNVENYRRKQHGLLDGEAESENVEDRRDNDMLRPPGRLGEAKRLDRALSGGNDQRTRLGTSILRDDLEDTGVRAKAPLGFSHGGSVQPAFLAARKPIKNYADGGAVEEDTIDQTGNVPYEPDLTGDEAPDPTPEGGGFRGAGSSGEYPQRVMQYLQGADAAHPDIAAQYEAQVDPDGTRDEGERKVLAVAAAAQDEGPDAAAGLSASYRQKYDAYRGMAAGALAHGDLDKASEAASKAYPNVLDGADVRFARQGDGVTATVTRPGKEPESFPLSKNQFNEFLRGNAGQYDHVMDLGAETLLKDLSRSGGVVPTEASPGTPAQAAGPKMDQWIDDQGIQRAGNPEDHPEGKRTGTPAAARPVPKFNNPYRDMGISDQAAQRAMARFPMISQNAQRMEYMEKLQNSENQGEIDRLKITDAGEAKKAAAESQRMGREHAAETGILREKVRQEGQRATAIEKGQFYERVNAARNGVRTEGDRLKALTAIRKIEAEAQTAQEKAAASLLGKELLNVPLGKPLSKSAQKAAETMESFQRTAPQAPGQTAPAPQPQSGGARVPGKNGEWYVQRSDGKFYKEKQ